MPDFPDFDSTARLAPTASAKRVAIASTAASQVALAANPNRTGLTAFNTDANACYVVYGAQASATDFTVKIPAEGYWEMPQPIYLGPLHVIWSADGTGSLYLTELSV